MFCEWAGAGVGAGAGAGEPPEDDAGAMSWWRLDYREAEAAIIGVSNDIREANIG